MSTAIKPGRPSSYSPEYCEAVIELGKQGKSREQIAATLGITRKTLWNWEQAHEDFLHALDEARLHEMEWWESIAQNHMIEEHQGAKINSSIWSRSMAARFPEKYRENRTVAVTGADGGAVKIEDATPLETARRVAFLLRQGLESEDDRGEAIPE